MPFITEALWQQLPHKGESIMVAAWPQAGERDIESERAFETLMGLVTAIRNVRVEAGVEPARWIAADVYPGQLADEFESARRELGFLARIADDQLRIHTGAPVNEPNTLSARSGDVVASLPLAEMVDLEAEKSRLEKELAEAQEEKSRAEKQLANKGFVDRAPEQVVQVQRDRLIRSEEQIASIRERIAALAGE
jgi:valyl-tRNA synthetase